MEKTEVWKNKQFFHQTTERNPQTLRVGFYSGRAKQRFTLAGKQPLCDF
jgi:hypothetical protein